MGQAGNRSEVLLIPPHDLPPDRLLGYGWDLLDPGRVEDSRSAESECQAWQAWELIPTT